MFNSSLSLLSFFTWLSSGNPAVPYPAYINQKEVQTDPWICIPKNPSPFTLIKLRVIHLRAGSSIRVNRKENRWTKYSTLYYINRFWKKIMQTKHRIEEGGAGRSKSKQQEWQERKKCWFKPEKWEQNNASKYRKKLADSKHIFSKIKTSYPSAQLSFDTRHTVSH